MKLRREALQEQFAHACATEHVDRGHHGPRGSEFRRLGQGNVEGRQLLRPHFARAAEQKPEGKRECEGAQPQKNHALKSPLESRKKPHGFAGISDGFCHVEPEAAEVESQTKV